MFSFMGTLLDRQLFFSYLKAYIVCLVSLLGLFIVVDLFTHLDDFAQASEGVHGVFHHIFRYYLNMTAQIFDRLSEAIVLLAGMFTVAWLQRNNELVPLLSAGVSTQRVVRPVLLGAFLMLGLTTLNQEIILPRVDRFLIEHRGDPNGEKETQVPGGYEANGIFISGETAIKKELTVRKFVVVCPQSLGRMPTLQAKEARYIPPGPEGRTGGWLLTGTIPSVLENWTQTEILELIVPGQYFLKTNEIDFDKATRNKNWHYYTPTPNLYLELGRTDTTKTSSVAVLFHMRLTRPILGMILIVMGLGTILRDQNRNVFISAGLCLGLVALFFISCFACQSLGNEEFVSPALAAWLPVLFFGPLALVMFDAVHT